MRVLAAITANHYSWKQNPTYYAKICLLLFWILISAEKSDSVQSPVGSKQQKSLPSTFQTHLTSQNLRWFVWRARGTMGLPRFADLCESAEPRHWSHSDSWSRMDQPPKMGHLWSAASTVMWLHSWGTPNFTFWNASLQEAKQHFFCGALSGYFPVNNGYYRIYE